MEQVLNEVVDIVKESIAWEFEALDEAYLKDKINEMFIIVKRP